MSRHECLVVSIKLEEHPNADTLSAVKVFGYQCVVRTADWKDGDLAVYIPPDSVVPDTEPFQFLKRPDSKHWNRIRVVRLRGFISMGLLIPAPEGAVAGDDVMEAIGVTHYEPPIPEEAGGDNERGPGGWYPTYDVENFRRFNDTLNAGEGVVITEKIHGASAKFTWMDDRMWSGSRISWKKADSGNMWWQAIAQNPWIREWCSEHPNLVVYGEVFGMVKHFKYGKPGEVQFNVFDIWDKDHWMDHEPARELGSGLVWVPQLYQGPFDAKMALELAEGNSSVAGAEHIREGVVVKPLTERTDPEMGRVQLKIVSSRYLSKDW